MPLGDRIILACMLVDQHQMLQLLADRQFVDSSKVCPEAKASIFSIITFGWISNLMRQGYKYVHSAPYF